MRAIFALAAVIVLAMLPAAADPAPALRDAVSPEDVTQALGRPAIWTESQMPDTQLAKGAFQYATLDLGVTAEGKDAAVMVRLLTAIDGQAADAHYRETLETGKKHGAVETVNGTRRDVFSVVKPDGSPQAYFLTMQEGERVLAIDVLTFKDMQISAEQLRSLLNLVLDRLVGPTPPP